MLKQLRPWVKPWLIRFVELEDPASATDVRLSPSRTGGRRGGPTVRRLPRLRCRRCVSTPCVVCNVLLLVCVYMLVVYLRGPPVGYFRASPSLLTLAEYRRATTRTVPLLQEMLQAHPHMHCLGGPAARLYEPVLVLRRHKDAQRVGAGEFRVLFNPTLISGAVETDVEEESSLCATDPNSTRVRPVVRKRYTEIVVEHMPSPLPLSQERLALSSYDAVCVQHYLDIFAGVWPCAEPLAPGTLILPRILRANQTLDGHGGLLDHADAT